MASNPKIDEKKEDKKVGLVDDAIISSLPARPKRKSQMDEEEFEEYQETMIPRMKGAPEANFIALLDSEDLKEAFRMALGYKPVFNQKGELIGFERETPDAFDQLLAALNIVGSKKITAIANVRDSYSLTRLELEMQVERLFAMFDIIMPDYVDELEYIIPTELAKMEFKKGLSLAEHSMVLRGAMGQPIPLTHEQPIVPTTQQAEKKQPAKKKKLFGIIPLPGGGTQ